jgi:hypothetical protein
MSVTSVLDYAGPFAPDGVTTTFPFTFAALSADEVAVIRIPDDWTDESILTGYTVQLNDNNTGQVTFTSAPLAGDPLYVVSNPSFEQQTRIATQGKFSAAAIEKAFDRTAIRDIVLAGAISRAPLAPPADTLGVLPSAPFRAGMVLGFDATGQAIPVNPGGADSALRTDLAAPTGASLLGWVAAGVGSVVRTIRDKLMDTPSITDWGAVGDNAKKKSRILQTTATQPVVNVTADYSSIEHLSVDYTVTPASGSTAAIIANGQHCNYKSIIIGNCYNGFKFTISPFQNATEIQIFNYINSAFWLTAVNDIFVTHAKLDAGNATNGIKGGIWLQDRVEAFSFMSVEILNGVRPITTEAVSNTANNRPAYGNFTAVYFDSAAQDALFQTLVESSFVAPWFSNGRSGSGYPGATFDAVDSIDILGGRFANCGSHGCALTANAKRVNFTTPSFESNSVTAGSGVAHGLSIAAATTDFAVIGGRAHNGLLPGQQGYGIFIAAGASDNYVIEGVNLSGNVTGGLSDGGTGTSKYIRANHGARTSKRGTGTVATGTSSIAVAHGLAFTPTAADVIISPTASLAACGVTSLWVSAVDATNITVSTNTNTTSNLAFTWDARVKGG